MSDYDEIENILKKAKILQQPSLSIDTNIGNTSISEKLTNIYDNTLKMVNDDSRRVIISYYRLWMLYIITWLANIFLYIQLFTIVSDKSSKGISLPAYIIFLVSGISWFIYGFLLKDVVLLISNIIKLVGVIALIIIILKYK